MKFRHGVLAGSAVVVLVVTATAGTASAGDAKISNSWGEGSVLLADRGDSLNFHVGAKDKTCDSRGVGTQVEVYRNGGERIDQYGYRADSGCNISGSTPFNLNLSTTKGDRSGYYTVRICKTWGNLSYGCTGWSSYGWAF